MAGEFRLVPASDYVELEGDAARQDNELLREETSPGDGVTVTHLATGRPIRVIGDLKYRHEIGADYYTLCLSSTWDPLLFDDFKGSNSCLVIHDPVEFCERVHFHAKAQLQDWAGVDGAVSYAGKSQLGAAFSKHWKYLTQKEWRFAWYPSGQLDKLTPIFVRIGSIEQLAEIVRRPETNQPTGR